MSTFNGIGTELKGFTRPDASGMHFGTRYFVVFGLPVIPLGRYYLRQTSMSAQAMNTTTRYAIAGRSRLRFSEVLKTYLFCWIYGPAVVLIPILLLLSNADAVSDKVGFGWVIGGFAFWLLASIAFLVTLLAFYRDNWAPIRQVRWLERRSSRY